MSGSHPPDLKSQIMTCNHPIPDPVGSLPSTWPMAYVRLVLGSWPMSALTLPAFDLALPPIVMLELIPTIQAYLRVGYRP